MWGRVCWPSVSWQWCWRYSTPPSLRGVWFNQKQGVPDDARERQGRWNSAGESVAPSVLPVVVHSILSLAYLVSLSVMRNCSGLSTKARIGVPKSFILKVKNSSCGEGPLGDGRREKKSWVGENLAVESVIMLVVWDHINKTFFCCFPSCRWLV